MAKYRKTKLRFYASLNRSLLKSIPRSGRTYTAQSLSDQSKEESGHFDLKQLPASVHDLSSTNPLANLLHNLTSSAAPKSIPNADILGQSPISATLAFSPLAWPVGLVTKVVAPLLVLLMSF